MPRQKLVATTTVTTEVKLSPKARQMVKARCVEHADLSRTIKVAKTRQGNIRKEVDTLFTTERQGKALLDGTSIDGHRLKMVLGKRKVFNALGFMKKHGVDQNDFDEFTTYEDNEPYIKLTAPGERDE